VAEPTVAGVPAQTEPRDDVEKVQAWRLGEAMRLGFGYAQALEFACSDGDLHQLEELVGNGCPRDLALRIVT
jgi:hypothetical protein